MRFWQIYPPDYKSDYQNSYINGSLDHLMRFPSVDCDVCATSWGLGLRSLPYQCPESLRSKMSTAPHHSLPRAEHLALQRKLFDELLVNGRPFVDIRPGTGFLLVISTFPRGLGPIFCGLSVGCLYPSTSAMCSLRSVAIT